MNAIYEPTGLAREYAEKACNLFRGCTNGCTYCYVPAILRMTREEFHAAAEPRPGILEALDRDCRRMAEAGDWRRVMFCFSCDPYPATTSCLTRDALLTCEKYGIPFSVLTKGGWRARYDFDILERTGGWFGSTLTCRGPLLSSYWEPNAASPRNRKDAIMEAHDIGIFTWVSLEPLMDITAALYWVNTLRDHVDLWRVGKWNYSPEAKAIDWPAFAGEVLDALQQTGASYVLKRDLAKHLPAGTVTEYWREGVRPS